MGLKDRFKSLRKSFAKKVFDKKTKTGKTLKIDNVKTILFLRDDDKIGDMVVSTLMFRELKNKYPDIKIFVLCGKNNSQIIEHNPYIECIYEISGSFFKDFFLYRKLRKLKVDVAVDFFTFRPRPLHLLKLRIIDSGFLIGYYKQLYNVYDLSIEKDFFSEHISKRYQYLLEVLGVNDISLKYDIFFSEKEKNNAKNLIDKCNKKYKILINPFAASVHRSFSFEKLKNLIELIKANFNCCIYIISQKNNYNKIKSLLSEDVYIINSSSILESAALIKYSDIIITPDTSIVHIASAFEKKTVALYRDYSGTDEKIDIIWGPNNSNAISLNADTKNGRAENNINSIGNELIIDALKKMI